MDINALHTALAAVCPINGVSVTDPGNKTGWRIDFAADVSEAQRAAALDAMAAFDATKPPPPVLSFNEFMDRFTQEEQAAIVASTDVQLKIWLLKAAGADEIDFGNTQVHQGVAYLVTLGLITPDRQTTILAG